MSEIFKVIGTEAACNTTPSTFGGSKTVRLININTSPWLITQVSNASVTLGTITLAPSQVITLEKATTDTLQSNTASSFVLAVPVAYKN